jgi:AcrR family transcriptional regulator
VTAIGRARPGGRTARTEKAVLDATLTELATRRYDQISVEGIAGRAGVHKTTVYRRWGSKDTLVAAALETMAGERIGAPETGDIDADLRSLARAAAQTLGSRDGAAAARALVSAGQDSSAVRDVLRRYWTARAAHVGPVIERAIDRGDLPAGTDSAELIGYVAAPLYHRLLVTGQPLTEAVADRAAAAALAAARAGIFVRS